MDERRKLKRLRINLDVYDQASGSLLGYTSNLHAEGMMMVSENPFVIGKGYSIWLEIPDGDKDTKKIFLAACSRWCTSVKDPMLYYTGFRFVHPTPEIMEYAQIFLNDLVT